MKIPSARKITFVATAIAPFAYIISKIMKESELSCWRDLDRIGINQACFKDVYLVTQIRSEKTINLRHKTGVLDTFTENANLPNYINLF